MSRRGFFFLLLKTVYTALRMYPSTGLTGSQYESGARTANVSPRFEAARFIFTREGLSQTLTDRQTDMLKSIQNIYFMQCQELAFERCKRFDQMNILSHHLVILVISLTDYLLKTAANNFF